ncbi:EutN/CcmL family microcompartment protein [bacterium]|nr:EutN/CcmL family microcompartment protein [bacterium]
MRLGKVIGRVWSEHKIESLKSCALYLVQPVDSGSAPAGRPLVAADPQRIAGPGDSVVYVTNTDAVQTFDSVDPPVNACIVELVDSIE